MNRQDWKGDWNLLSRTSFSRNFGPTEFQHQEEADYALDVLEAVVENYVLNREEWKKSYQSAQK